LSVQSSPSVATVDANVGMSDVSGVSPPRYSSLGPQVVQAPLAMPAPQRFVTIGVTPGGNFSNFGRGRGFRGPCFHCGNSGPSIRVCLNRQVSAPGSEVPTSQKAEHGWTEFSRFRVMGS